MKPIWLMAHTSFRELIRERFVWIIAIMALSVVVLSLLLGEMTFDEGERILADVGLLASEISTMALALFLGSFVLARELERQTCLLILSKPVSRLQFLLGKWVGIAALLIALVLVMDLTLNILIGHFPGALLIVSLSILVKALILLSWALFAANFSRPILALLSGFCLSILGHWLGDLEFFAQKSRSAFMAEAVKGLRWIIPNFDLFNWKDHFHLVHPPELRDIIGMGLHGLAWIFILLAAAGFLFRRKDLV